MNGNELKQIRKFLGGSPNDGSPSSGLSTADIFEVLCQIALALLIIFMMANVIFMGRAETAIATAEDMIGFWHREYERVANTPEGKIDTERKEALIEVQKQKLIVALEKIEYGERLNFGISIFTKKNNKGETEYLMDDILSEGKIVNERFKKACILANETLPYRKKMKREWLDGIALNYGLVLSDSPVAESIVEHPEKIHKDNAVWLLGGVDKKGKKQPGEINSRITSINADCRDMQGMAVAYLIEYYTDHTDALKSTKLDKQLDNSLSQPSEERVRLMSDFSKELLRYVKSLFKAQKIPLLSGV